VLDTWKEAQLEPNTLIEAEGLSANAKARAEALRLETFEEGGKFVITLLLLFFFIEKKRKLTYCWKIGVLFADASDLTDVEYSSSDGTSDATVSGENSEAGESEDGKSVAYQ
jgi:hypothetical protein